MATLKEVIECRNKVNYEYFRRGQPAFTSNKLKLQGIYRLIQVKTWRYNLLFLSNSPSETTKMD